MASSEQIKNARNAKVSGRGSLVLAVIVIAAVTTVSFLPTSDKSVLHTHGKYHYWGHMMVFAVVAYLAVRTAKGWWGQLGMFGLSVIFGFGLEAGERIVFRSPMEWKDVLVDAFGVIGGAVVALIAGWRSMASK